MRLAELNRLYTMEGAVKIAISGLGKAGKALAEYIIEKTDDTLVCAICRDESKAAGLSIAEALKYPSKRMHTSPVIALSQAASHPAMQEAEVLIDFSSSKFTTKLCDLCCEVGCNLVVCTTNHEESAFEALQASAEDKRIGIVYAPNITLGINLLIEVTRRLSRLLPDFDFAIMERHRADKAPVTATAQMIANAAEDHDVSISYMRAGGYVGVHELTAASENERITIIHESFSRSAFANGAVLAAHFVIDKKGFFTMQDVLKSLAV